MEVEKYTWQWKRLLAIVATSILILVFFPYRNPTHWLEWFSCFWIDFAYTFILWEGCLFITMKIREKHPGIDATKIRVAYIYTGILFYVVVALLVLNVTINFLMHEDNTWSDFWFGLRVSLIVTLIILSIYEAKYFYVQWSEASKVAEQLKQENSIAQLEGLKSQINPHFLFNSLNTLSAIIAENQSLAIDFVQKLADVYRYILNVKDKQTVPLATELGCVEAYVFLLKIRYEHLFQVEISVDESKKDWHIPPVSLQMLVENAIKHNVISREHPLFLKIYTQEDYLLVENNFQPKMDMGTSNGIGLQNIKSRYSYLTDRPMWVENDQSQFKVHLPLLDLKDKM